MGLFNRDKNKSTPAAPENTAAEDTARDSEINIPTESETSAVVDNEDKQLHYDSLEESIVDAIGTGSEDVKNIVVTTTNGRTLTAVVAAGMIKNVYSDSDYHISNRLNWVDPDVIDENTVNQVDEIFDNNDFFDALNLIIEKDLGGQGATLAEIISETYAERSMKNLVEFRDYQVSSVSTNWILDSDSDAIESYSGFSLDPETIDFAVDSVVENNADARKRLGNPTLFATEKTQYFDVDSDVERYVAGAVYFMNDTEDGEAETVDANRVIEFSDGFAIVDVVKAIESLIASDTITDVDPEYVEEPEDTEDTYNEDTTEGDETDGEVDDLDLAMFAQEQEARDDVYDPIDEFYPVAIAGGTQGLGGSMVQDVEYIRNSFPLKETTEAVLDYSIAYNSLYEQSVQGVEYSLDKVVSQLDTSKKIYGSMESLGGESADIVSQTSNLYRSAYYLEKERNELNASRIDILRTLKDAMVRAESEIADGSEAVGDDNDTSAKLVELANKVIADIDYKIEAISLVEDVVTGEKSSNYIAPHAGAFTADSVPLFYELAKKHGLEV